MADDDLRALERSAEAGGWPERRRYVEALRRVGRRADAYRSLRASAEQPEALRALVEVQPEVLSRTGYGRRLYSPGPPPTRPRAPRLLWGDPGRRLQSLLPAPWGTLLVSGEVGAASFDASDPRIQVLDDEGQERFSVPCSGPRAPEVAVAGSVLVVVERGAHGCQARAHDAHSGARLGRRDLGPDFVDGCVESEGIVLVDPAGGLRVLRLSERPDLFRPVAPERTNLGTSLAAAGCPAGFAIWGQQGLSLFAWGGKQLNTVSERPRGSDGFCCDEEGVLLHEIDGALSELDWAGALRWTIEQVAEWPVALGREVVAADVGMTGRLNVIDRATGAVRGELPAAQRVALQGDAVLTLTPGCRELVATSLDGEERWRVALDRLKPPVFLLQSPPYAVYLRDSTHRVWVVHSD